ncbi:hypothetical protein JCM16358_01700 [Halanaerocella petrolearia]
MQLSDFLAEISNKQLNQLARQHHICYENNFSKLWITDKLKRKLLDRNYLQKITKQLDPAAKKMLKQLINTELINKKTADPETCYQLKQSGLIYEKDNFYYLPQDIKSIMTNKWKQKVTEKMTQPKIKPKLRPLPISNSTTNSKIKINQPVQLTFYHYLLLILSQIKQRKNKEDLLSYLEQINFTSFSSKKLLQYITRYSKYNNLVTDELNQQLDIKSWLQTNYSQKLLQGIETFFPYSKHLLRQITAVLNHKSTKSQLSLKFVEDNLQLNKINQDSQDLLELLDIFQFTKDNLSLTAKANKAFDPEIGIDFDSPQVTKQNIIVGSNISLSALWNICQSAQLTRLDNKLIFTSKNGIKKFR